MISASDYQYMIYKLDIALLSGEKSYSELINSASAVNTSNFSTIKKDGLLNELRQTTDNLYLLSESIKYDIKSFINEINNDIISNNGDLNNYLINNSIIIPLRLFNLMNEMGYNLSESIRGDSYNEYTISSSTSSILTNINFVIKLADDLFSWHFNKDFINDDIILSDVLGLLINGKKPINILSFDNSIIVLRYLVSTGSDWSIQVPVNIKFSDGTELFNESGTIVV